MKICFVLPNMNVGGQEWLTIWLSEQYRQAGHEVWIVCLSGKGVLLPECHDRGLEVIVPERPYCGTFLHANLVLWLRRHFRQRRPDVVHSQAFEANYFSRIAGVGLPGSFIAHEHNIYPNKRKIHFLIEWVLSHKSARVICISQAVAEFHLRNEKLNRALVSVVPNGVPRGRLQFKRPRAEVRAELGVAETIPLLVSTATLKPQKGHAVLIEAFARLRHRNSVLALVGSGPLESKCREMATSLKVGDRVRFLGKVHDVADYLRAADVFVLSSLWEGFGIAIVEAALARRPIVASAVDGIREIVEDGQSAFLVPPGEPVVLAERLDGVLDLLVHDPGRIGPICEAAYQRVTRFFSIERVAQQLLEIYRESATACH